MKRTILLTMIFALCAALWGCGAAPPTHTTSGAHTVLPGTQATIPTEEPTTTPVEEPATETQEANREVPNTLVEYTISDAFPGQTYQYEAVHEYDADSHIDAVSVTVQIPQQYCVQIYQSVCLYQYDQSSDLWNEYQTAQWEDVGYRLIPENFIRDWEGALSNASKEPYDCSITDLDIDNLTVTGTFHTVVSDLYLSGKQEITELNETGTFQLTQSGNTYVVTFYTSAYRFEFVFWMGGIRASKLSN